MEEATQTTRESTVHLTLAMAVEQCNLKRVLDTTNWQAAQNVVEVSLAVCTLVMQSTLT